MQIRFSCPRCDQHSVAEVTPGTPLDCSGCGLQVNQPADAWDGDRLTRCLVCPSGDLFVRKDFPQRLGVAIVVFGFALSCLTWFFYWTTLTFVVLFATAMVDFVLYLIVGESVVCYRCHAEYRQIPTTAAYQPFSLDTHERYRQQAARLASAGAERSRPTSAGRTDGPDVARGPVSVASDSGPGAAND